MHMDMSGKPFHARIYRKHAAPQDRDAEFVRACTVEMHMGILEEPFYPRIYRRNATPQKLAARFVRRSRNAHWHVTGAISCKNLQEKSRGSERVPWSNPGLNPYRKNPSVYRHCLGNTTPKNDGSFPHLMFISSKCPSIPSGWPARCGTTRCLL